MRRQADLIFCNVEFEDYGKTYCYLTDDDTLEAGDYVVVPVGKDNNETLAQIESMEYHSAEDAPFSIKESSKSMARRKQKYDIINNDILR